MAGAGATVGVGLAGPLAYGVVDSVHTGATAVLGIAGGYVADRVRSRKLVAGFGYALSALAKPALLLAGRSVPAIGVVIAVDRLGKGIRTAPGDVLITESVPPAALGRAFGVHRMTDAAGAFLGPLVTLGVLAATAGSYDAVFVGSFCIAALAVVVLVLFVRERRADRPATDVNFWGVTFTADDNRFYATMSTRTKRYLVRGDLAARTVETPAENVECPSLSPDGTRLAFKQAIGADPARGWRLSVPDLAGMRVTATAEPASVDDQAAWLG